MFDKLKKNYHKLLTKCSELVNDYENCKLALKSAQDKIKSLEDKTTLAINLTIMVENGFIPYAIERINGKTEISIIRPDKTIGSNYFICGIETHNKLVEEFKIWSRK